MKNSYLRFTIPICIILGLGSLYSFKFKDKKKITVFIVGDSTVKNGQGDGKNGLWGWGDPIRFHFDSTKVQVRNYALGGTSSRSFQTRGLWQNVLQEVQAGDYVLIQFGHNDGGSYNKGRARASIKGIGKDSITVVLEASGEKEIVHTYGWYLRKYIMDTKSKGAIPIVVTPIPRNDWKDNHVDQKNESYPDWAIKIAKEENVDFIDLNKMMTDKMNMLGELRVTGNYFFKRDHTHTTARGAQLNASIVANSILSLKNCELSRYIIENPEYIFPSKPKILIIGDSTVKNRKGTKRGWGDELHAYIDTNKISIVNKARGGRSSRTFIYEGLWDEVLSMAQPGDYLLLQFGHNDGGGIDTLKMRGSLKGISNDSVIVQRPDNETEIVHTYGWYIRKYISDARIKGIIPIVLSPVPRSRWSEGKVELMDKTYSLWAKQAADSLGACFIDQNSFIASKYQNEIGEEKVSKEFFDPDRTHTTLLGAQYNAQYLSDLIKLSGCCDLDRYLLSKN